MASVNKVIIVGHMGADPEVRYTQGGQPVASLRVATSESWTDKQGARQERTEWHQVAAWGKTAEACGKFLAKGRQVYVEGRLQSREYTDKEGQARKVWEIQADNVVFLGGGDGGGRSEGGGSSGGRQGGTQGGGGGRPAGGQGGGNAGGGWGGGGGGNGPSAGDGFDDEPLPF